MMSASVFERALQLGARRRRIADRHFDSDRSKIKLEPVELICTLCRQRLVRLFLLGCFHGLALAQQRIDQGDDGGELIVDLAVLMKLLFAFSDDNFSIGGMA